MRPIALLILFLAPAVLACDLNVRAHTTELPSSIEWDRYIGAFSYLVTESSDGFVTTRTYEVPTNSFTIPHRVSEVTKFSYRVEAHFETDQVIDGSCRGAIELALRPDPQFRKMTRKVIVPIVGSVVGATGAKFRTSLRITSTTGQQHGRIVFHPAGQASDSDPSIPYSFDRIKQSFAWDDIVQAIGATGIGSLDIVPDEDADPAAPTVLARHYTDAPNGTFGSFEPAVQPFDFITPAGFAVNPPDQGFRLNVGFRTLTTTTVSALVFDSTGHVKDLKTLSLPGDYFTLIPSTQLVGELAPGETFSLSFSGSVIPFYTLTENGTNDPAVVIPRTTNATFVQ
ncbi:MAG TPA: hypothetical protein VJ901_09670 [Thermoanaerobaculia bacterium]|nr:hypothetical protein [Thermoanaerobaculia bacterium]